MSAQGFKSVQKSSERLSGCRFRMRSDQRNVISLRSDKHDCRYMILQTTLISTDSFPLFIPSVSQFIFTSFFIHWCAKLKPNVPEIAHIKEVFSFFLSSFTSTSLNLTFPCLFWSPFGEKTLSYLCRSQSCLWDDIQPVEKYRPPPHPTVSSSHAYSITLLSWGQHRWHHPLSCSHESYLLMPLKVQISNKCDNHIGPLARNHQDFIIILGGDDISRTRPSLQMQILLDGTNEEVPDQGWGWKDA